MVSEEIEYIEPTQEHIGQMVEVSDDFQHWYFHKLLGIINAKQKYIVEEDLIVFGWVHARIPRPKPQPAQETTTKPIDWTKPVRTKDGRAVRVLCTDGPGEYPVVGFIDGSPAAMQWTSIGELIQGFPREKDLENVPQRIQREYWVNVYQNGLGTAYETKYAAGEARGTQCLACVKITIDCEEGNGL